MKKTILLTLLLLIVSISGYSQSSSANITASANIIKDILAEAVKGVEIGDVVPGQQKTILPESEDAGHVNISSTNRNTSYTLTVTVPENLVSDGTGGYPIDSMPVVFTFKGSAVQGDKSTLFTVVPGNLTEYSVGPSGAFGTIMRSLYIGAVVTPTEDQQGGVYSGELTVSLVIN